MFSVKPIELSEEERTELEGRARAHTSTVRDTSTTARWRILSSSVAIPSGRCRPSGFGMYTLREGLAR